jgi:hypothetical protein
VRPTIECCDLTARQAIRRRARRVIGPASMAAASFQVPSIRANKRIGTHGGPQIQLKWPTSA